MTKAETKRNPGMKRLIGFSAGLMLAASGPAWAQQTWSNYCHPTPSETYITCMSVMVDGNAVVMNWTPPTSTELIKFWVKRTYRTRKDGPHSKAITIAELPATATTYTDTTVEPGKAYYYQVQAVRGPRPGEDGERVFGWADVREVTGGRAGGISIDHWPPQHLMGWWNSREKSFTLGWEPGTDPDYTKQKVLRRQAKGSWTVIAELPPTVHSYSDATVVPGEKYIYAIRGEKANGKGRRSKGLKINAFVDKPIRPSNFRIFLNPFRDCDDQFSWDPASDEEGYVLDVLLRKKLGSDDWVRVVEFSFGYVAFGLCRYSWLPFDAESGDQYFFRLKAERADGTGRLSNKVGIVVP